MSGKVRLAGVIGYPAAHSKSPLIHNFWLRSMGLVGLYAPLEIAPEDFDGFLDMAGKLGFVGFNVTAPHKERAYARMDALGAAAEACGSVNTILIRADGSFYGDSTDGYGFIENLRQGEPDLDLEGATVAMLGAGGAARAVVAALLDAGVAELRLANRTAARAEELSALFGERVKPWSWPVEQDFYVGARVVVNATSLGMSGGPDFVWELPSLGSSVVATDLIYAPLETPFLAAARAQGAEIVDGFGMLLHQARPGFEFWFGRDPKVTPELRAMALSSSGYIP